MSAYDEIKKLCDENKIPMTKLEEELGFGRGSIGKMKNAKRPNADRLQKIADYFGVPLSDLMESTGDTPKKKKNIIRVYDHITTYTPTNIDPEQQRMKMIELFTGKESIRITNKVKVLGRVAAGIPIEANEDVVDELEVSGEMAWDGNYFGLIIKGDSMEPNISNGDVIIVRQQEDANDGDIVVALVNGNDATCKKLRKYEDGSVALVSINPAYSPMYFSKSEVDDTPVRIIGKVKELRRKF